MAPSPFFLATTAASISYAGIQILTSSSRILLNTAMAAGDFLIGTVGGPWSQTVYRITRGLTQPLLEQTTHLASIGASALIGASVGSLAYLHQTIGSGGGEGGFKDDPRKKLNAPLLGLDPATQSQTPLQTMAFNTPILISLDGNIGAGKSTLLEAIQKKLPQITVVQEPVADWVTLKNKEGKNLLELFYADIPRWGYTFQNCAILTRLMHTMEILQSWKPEAGKLPVIITERSVLTDRYVFAEMLHREGKIDDLEWSLYLKWFNYFAANLPVKGVIHLTTSATTSKERIAIRGRSGEEKIPIEYLESLHSQHNHWIENLQLPVLDVSTEAGVSQDETLEKIRTWVEELCGKSKTA